MARSSGDRDHFLDFSPDFAKFLIIAFVSRGLGEARVSFLRNPRRFEETVRAWSCSPPRNRHGAAVCRRVCGVRLIELYRRAFHARPRKPRIFLFQYWRLVGRSGIQCGRAQPDPPIRRGGTPFFATARCTQAFRHPAIQRGSWTIIRFPVIVSVE
jgi:hypothetical protein